MLLQMNKNILVSIRCLAYNHAPYIRQCLEGFVMQKTDFKFEAIVHDDASTDGTSDIIREYAEKYPEIIKPIFETENQYSKHDGSISKIMNAEMRGKYIAKCEGDDYWTDPYKLQKQVDFLEMHPNVVGCVTNCSVVDNKGILLQEVRLLPVCPDNKQGEYNLHDFFKGSHQYPTLTAVYRKNAYDTISPMFEKCRSRFLGDWILWTCLLTQGNFYFLNDVTAAYRINPTSVTHTQNAVLRWKEDFQIRRNLISVLPKEYHKYLKNDEHAYFKIGMAYRKMGKYPQVMWNFFRAFCCSPIRFVKQIRELLANKKGT